jgi:two-component system LytT family sensor kinase
MVGRFNRVERKYFWIEVVFFIVFYYLFPIFTDIEYAYNERGDSSLFIDGLSDWLVYGTTRLFSGVIFYLIVRHALVSKKLMLFILYTALFLTGLHYYTKAVYLIVANWNWLPQQMRQNAARWAQRDVIHFSVVYMFREFLCIGALAYFIYSNKKEAELRALKEQQLLSELNYLKAQLHPHFFFNTMNNIYSLALKQSKDTAPVVARLADMMRYILYEADQAKVALTKEISFLSNYVEVERIRHQHNTIQFDVQGINDDAMIEPLLLLPFIENAFKHGLEQETGRGFVSIILCVIENELTLEVSNSKPIAPNPSTGIGLQNVSKRLTLMYPNSHDLQVNEKTETYHVTLTLQLK